MKHVCPDCGEIIEGTNFYFEDRFNKVLRKVVFRAIPDRLFWSELVGNGTPDKCVLKLCHQAVEHWTREGVLSVEQGNLCSSLDSSRTFFYVQRK